jgi:hypothetical protein
MWLRDDRAGEPRGATLHERQVVRVNLEQPDSGSPQLVRFVTEAVLSYPIRQLQLRSGRGLYDEGAAALDELPGPGVLVQHNGQFGRRVVESAGPGSRHNVVHAVMTR